MLSEPRAIFFQTELEWLPVAMAEFRSGPNIARRLYNRLFEHEFVDRHHFQNLDLQSAKPTLSTQSETKQSVCQFGERSISIEERCPDFEMDRFQEIVETVLTALRSIVDSIEAYEVPPFFMQRCRVQCLVQPAGTASSLELLAAKVANVMDSIDPFERPPSFFGVRFRFNPSMVEPFEGEPFQHESFSSVRFETYSQDPSQVWMEVASTFPFSDVLPTLSDLTPIRENLDESYRFLTVQCKAFLDQFDTSRGQAGGDRPQE